MKNTLLLACVFLFHIQLSAQTTAANTDEEAIKKVIVTETEQWMNQNYDAWSACFIHEIYLTWTVTNGGEPGDAVTMRGWENLKAFMQDWFQQNDNEFANEMRKTKMTRDQWNIQIRGNVAFVSFNQHSDSGSQKMDSTETRVLEKKDGAWRVAMQASVADFKDATPPIRSKY